MDKCRRNIVVLEPSRILYEGLYTSISKSEYDYSFFYVDSLAELETLMLKRNISIVLINPGIVQNRLKEFASLKRQYLETRWIGIIYAYYDNSILKQFDNLFSITEDISKIIRIINKICNNKASAKNQNEQLTERETDVLKWLAKGLSNKEIADKLNVSIHTVNTHRKNIMDKTSIRSLAGLTVYAVTKGIISLD
jgi:DNA-binding CsgD family transcriptional regulator/predicted DNA-binding transcriptional regulator